jgi:ATP-dependent DNA helicase RecQ
MDSAALDNTESVEQHSVAQHLARFGLASFRPGQQEVINTVLAGRDCLCIMPTGGGKSLCYQLPAVAGDGLTLVVSPLIALMKDQVDALQELGIPATCINSSLAQAEVFERLDAMAAGQYRLVYIAPERLRSTLFLEKLRASNLKLLAVDEAHCISQWGHDFRPDYARIGTFRQRLGFPPTIALTATATPEVRDDVIVQLQLREPQTFITGFARTNLHFEVHHAYSDVDKEQTLLDFLAETPGAGIIYCATRKRCEELVATLQSKLRGRKVGLYHAGLDQEIRRRVQDDFMSGAKPIIVATNAFGMGIDKADLRFVVHYNIPGSLEAYYQEAGRAGRDGQPSRCLLIYTPRDTSTQEWFIDNSYPEPEMVERVYDFLRQIDADPIELTLDEIRETLGLPIRSEGVSACEKLLENCGALERLDARQNRGGVRLDSDLPTLVDLLPKEAKAQRKVLRVIEQMAGEVRFERVFINPRELAKRCEMEPAAVTRALRELSKLKTFDYVAPFRGRAVHLLERDKPFDQLGIDFDEQERLKAAEYAMLQRVVDYATTRRCRQLDILDYFGDPSKKKCGLCDNCGGARPLVDPNEAAEAAGVDEGMLTAAKIVLSGVARMNQRGEFGKKLLAAMLVGKTSARLTKLRLDQLSTFGLLKQLTEAEAGELIDALLRQRLLMQKEVEKFKPVLKLTARGEQVMKGQGTLTEPLAIREAVARKLGVAAEPAPKKASGGRQPPEEPARLPEAPPSPQPSPKGRGSRQIEPEPDFDPFAEANAASQESTIVEQSAMEEPATASGAEAGHVRSSPHYWTWRVLSAGFTPDECRQIRRLSGEELEEHVLLAARDGQPVDPAWVLTGEQMAALEKLVDVPVEKLPSRLAKLPPGLKYRDVQIFLLSRGLVK